MKPIQYPSNVKNKTLILATLLVSASSAVHAASYLRAGAIFVDPTQSGVDSGMGALAEFGGTMDRVDLGFETGWVKLDAGPVREDFAPVLVAIRGRLPLDASGRLTLFAGGSAGSSYIRVAAFGNSANAWGFTWSGDVGVNFKPKSSRLDIAMGYKYLDVDFGSLAPDSGTANAFYATLGLHF